jgi:putative Mn2+ efflux pump MntP
MLGIIEMLAIACAVALDACAVAIAASVLIGKVSPRQIFRLAFHFGMFQAGMPVIGWLAGRSFHSAIADYDHWVAFALLVLIGGKALWESSRPADEKRDCSADPTRGISLVVLAIATSIDALAVGITFSLLDVSIWLPVIVIGLVTAAFTVAGMLLGNRLGLRFGKRIEAVAGLVLITIGVKILIEHMLAG